MSCSQNVLTVRWPTDVTVSADQTQPPTQLLAQTNLQLQQNTPLLDMLIITLKPP